VKPGRVWGVTSGRDEVEALLAGTLDRRGLIHGLNEMRDTNYVTISSRTRRFVLAAVLLVVQIALWGSVMLAR
jgi:hypothetical protein